MIMDTQFFEGQKVRLAPFDFEKDPQVESRWTHDPDYLRMLDLDPARPLSPAQVTKKYEEIEKKQEERRSFFHFTIRAKGGEAAEGQTKDEMIGFVRIFEIEWQHGTGILQIGIGEEGNRNRGFGSEALGMMLRYAFSELNLHRLTAIIPAYNATALHIFEKAGFEEEVRIREAVHRYGARWDLLHLGILQSEWNQKP